MKILILANNDIGLYKFRKELIENLLQKHDISICLPDGEFVKDLVSMGCTFIPCELLDRRGTNPIKDLSLFHFYKALMKNSKPNIVFTYTIKPNVYGGAACASLRIPYVANITGLGTAVENGGFLQIIALALYKFGLRKSQKVFFQNTENQQFFIDRGIVMDNQDLLPGSGVNLRQFAVKDYPSDDKVIRFAFISRIMKEKGIDQYLDTAKFIKKKYPNTEFHICGFCEDDYESTLKEYIDNNLVIYHGMIHDIADFLKDIHCVIHPTYYPEGISNVLLESCASGRPIITTDRAGCREVIDDEVNGFLVIQRDSDSLIKAVENFLELGNEERKTMGLNGRMKVEREFDRKIVVKKYIEELKR